MRLGIVCSANHSFGHAAVARALARAARAQLSLDRLIVFSDQTELLGRWNFFDDWMEVVPLNVATYPVLDAVLLDTIPFRRADALYEVLRRLSQVKPLIVVGHTGWVPAISPRHLNEWRELLSFLGGPRVIVYHGKDVCDGTCHLARFASRLGACPTHAGLLLPEVRRLDSAQPGVFAALSGGGDQARELLERVESILVRKPASRCDFYLGPYTNVESAPRRTRLISGVGDIGRLLSAYDFSVTRAGYSSCCEHIAAQVPTIIDPLPNPEQRANALWANRFLRVASIDYKGILEVREPQRARATTFSWVQALDIGP